MQNEWIEWAGGDCPVPIDVEVEYRTRAGGNMVKRAVAGVLRRWTHTDCDNDIVAYRRTGAAPLCWCDGVEPKDCKGCGQVKDSNPKDAIGDRKVPLALLSPIASAHWSLAQFAGMTKYGAWNWRVAGVRASVYLSAMKRHMDAYISGEELDPIDGTHHLGNIMACAAILLDAQAAGLLTDDRPPSVGLRDTYKFVEDVMARLREQYADKAPRHYTIADTEVCS